MAELESPDISSSPKRSIDVAPEKNLDADEIRLAQMGKLPKSISKSILKCLTIFYQQVIPKS